MSQHESVSAITEAKLVERVFDNPRTRAHVLDCHGFPANPTWRLAVPLTGLGDGLGDVDILAWTRDRPERAVAFEVKRFKAVLVGDEADAVNKLGEFDKAVVRQTGWRTSASLSSTSSSSSPSTADHRTRRRLPRESTSTTG